MQYLNFVYEDSDDPTLHTGPVSDGDAAYLRQAAAHLKPLTDEEYMTGTITSHLIEKLFILTLMHFLMIFTIGCLPIGWNADNHAINAEEPTASFQMEDQPRPTGCRQRYLTDTDPCLGLLT